MNIVILGGMGFLGRNLVAFLTRQANQRITVFDRLPLDHDAVKALPTSVNYVQGEFVTGFDFTRIVHNADLIIHLVSTSVPGTEQGVIDEINANVIPSTELFQACVQEGVGRILFMSSGGTVYGASNKHKNSETDLPDPINTYGLQKIMIEQALHLAVRNSATDYQIVRLSNPYGPGQNPHGALGLVTKLVYQALNHDTIHIFGDGSVVRDFIYIDDAIQAIGDIVERGDMNATYNVGRGIGTSVADVVNTIDAVLPERLNIVHTPGRAVDVPYSVLNIDKYHRISSIKEFVSLEEGIKRTYDFFKEHRQ